MKVKKEDTAYIADLAKLNISGAELDKMTTDLNEILGYVEKLNEIDTTNVEPLSHPIGMTNVFRDDKLQASVDHADAIANAPVKDDAFFRAPKVISQ
jgi:aspartyl-tRNA(Asn)/glutamyl-tRNA(Gln) amidotransferase subunit C